jgi:hypothetical protein
MMEDCSNSTVSNVQEAVQAARARGWPALKGGADAARMRLGDGMDLARDASRSLGGFVERQPIVAIAGAFLIGYLTAWMLRKATS